MSEQSPYPGQPSQPGFGQDPYGQYHPYSQQPAYGQPVAGPPGGYAHWGLRVLGHIVDQLFGLVPAIPIIAGYVWLIVALDLYIDEFDELHARGDVSIGAILLILLGMIASFAFVLWNYGYRQGKTGQTLGKQVVGISVVSFTTGRPIGFGMSVVRQIAHIVDGIFMLGYLWPLWDEKRQTFADKIMTTVVIRDPQA